MTDGSEVVSQTYASAAVYCPETLFFWFWYSFMSEPEYTLWPTAAEKIS
jgi:hypothetical protein